MGAGVITRQRIGMIVRIGCICLLVAGFCVEVYHWTRQGSDFWAFWAAGRLMDRGADPYSVSALSTIPSWQGSGYRLPFFSPPYVAEMLRPFGLLSFNAAIALWTAMSLAAACVLGYVLLELCGARATWRSAALMWCVFVAFVPFASSMHYGQTDLLVACLMAPSWYILTKRRLFWSGAVLALSAINPQLILGMGAYYVYRAVRRGEWTLVAGAASGGAVLAAASLLSPPLVGAWLTSALPRAQAFAASAPNQVTVLRLWHAAGGGSSSAALVVAFAAAGGLAVALWKWSHSESIGDDVAVAEALTLVMTTFAFIQDYMLVLLALPSAWAQWRRARSWGNSLVLAGWAISFSGIGGDLITLRHQAIHIVFPFLAIIAAGYGACLLRRDVMAWAVVCVVGYAAPVLVMHATWPQQVLLIGGQLAVLVGIGGPAWAPRLVARAATTASG